MAEGTKSKDRVYMLRENIPLCWFNRHQPDRDDVEWDGYNYVGTCRYCRAAIRRREKRRWEKDWIKARESA